MRVQRGRSNPEDQFSRQLRARMGAGLVANGGVISVPPGAGSGDVTGPGSSTDGDVVLFDGSTGKAIKSSGQSVAEIIAAGAAAAPQGDVVGPGASGDEQVALFDGVTGKLLKDSGATVADIVAAAVVAAAAAIIPVAWGDLDLTGSSLADLATRSASDLDAGTLPDGRFPSTLPALDGAALTNLTAANLVGALPALDGSALTDLAAANLTGTIAAAVQQAITELGTITGGRFANLALKVRDTGGDHDLIIAPGSDLSAESTLSLIMGGSARTLDLSYVGFAPVWTTSGAAPDLGNGTLTGVRIKQGKNVNVFMMLTIGSTTSVGSGAWFFSVPSAVGVTDLGQQGIGSDQSDSGRGYPMFLRLTSASTFAPFVSSTGAIVTPTNPITWATGDRLIMQYFYPEA